MRFCVFLFFVIGILALPAHRLVKAAGETFSLAVTTPWETVRTGSDVKLTIELTNTTNHDITLIDMDQWCDYTLEVRDSNGQSAPETEQKRNHSCTDNPVAGKRIMVKLRPGEHHETLVFVNDVFEMKRPDKYTFQAAREIPKELGQGNVKSNTIAITVTE